MVNKNSSTILRSFLTAFLAAILAFEGERKSLWRHCIQIHELACQAWLACVALNYVVPECQTSYPTF